MTNEELEKVLELKESIKDASEILKFLEEPSARLSLNTYNTMFARKLRDSRLQTKLLGVVKEHYTKVKTQSQAQLKSM